MLRMLCHKDMTKLAAPEGGTGTALPAFESSPGKVCGFCCLLSLKENLPPHQL